MQKQQDGRIVETAVEARGARPGRPVLYVLVAALVLVVAAYAGIYLGFFKIA